MQQKLIDIGGIHLLLLTNWINQSFKLPDFCSKRFLSVETDWGMAIFLVAILYSHVV